MDSVKHFEIPKSDVNKVHKDIAVEFLSLVGSARAALLEFSRVVAEKPTLRENLVKSGWASWEHRWREEIFKKTSKPAR